MVKEATLNDVVKILNTHSEEIHDLAKNMAYLVEHMATKEELSEFRLDFNTFKVDTETNFRSLRVEIKDVNRRLDELAEQYGDIKGVTKEIDELRDRMKVIEQHLGILKAA